jgi:hypothetical protein
LLMFFPMHLSTNIKLTSPSRMALLRRLVWGETLGETNTWSLMINPFPLLLNAPQILKTRVHLPVWQFGKFQVGQ